MYTEEELLEARKAYHKRWLIVGIPLLALFALVIASYIWFHNARDESGWIWTGLATILFGSCFIFAFCVYVRPMRNYCIHIDRMLHGRMRDTVGVFAEMDEQLRNRDGIDCISFIVNIGEKGDAEDDRLFYYDALKAKPSLPIGSRVTVRSNDKMVSSIALLEKEP